MIFLPGKSSNVLRTLVVVLVSGGLLVSSSSGPCVAAEGNNADNKVDEMQVKKAPVSVDLASLVKGQIVDGFRADAVYLVDSGRAVGGRFRHVRSGFTLDLLSLQTAPQAFIWVNTPPTSDMGEAHTQEHLLLGKGTKGRSVATLEEMSMTSSSAMTMQWRTCYHFNTTAGPDVFYQQVERRLDALLHPDYTDEEVAREVRNFGVAKDAKSGLLTLEEKGTVYNEMVSSVKSPGHALWRAERKALYGDTHPLYYLSGGTPAGLRKLTAADIHDFRGRNYVLHNMGMIAAVPKNMTVADVLTNLDGILSGLEPAAANAADLAASDIPKFPPPQPVSIGDDQIKIVDYPEKDPEKPGSIDLCWPANLQLDARNELLLGLFLSNLAGDPATPLYKKFIDRRTRFMDLGATGVSASASDEQGFPIHVSLGHVAKTNINPTVIARVREEVQKELATIASWPDDSPELEKFNSHLRDLIIATRRAYGKFVNSPPGFGNRWQGSGWMSTFLTLEREGGFHRSVTLKPEIAAAEKELSEKKNIWRHYLKEWGLLDTKPMAFASRPDPQLLVQEESGDKERVAAETDRLKKQYGAVDDQTAIKDYQTDYEKKTAELEELAKHDKPARLVQSLPLTFDDQLEYKVSNLDGVPIVSSNFETMTGGTAGLALRVDCIEEKDLFYLSFLPMMINSVGVIIDGKPVSYEDMLEMWRREILHVGCSISSNVESNRYELVMSGSGNDPIETQKSIVWMGRLLHHPDWRTENLSRIRDVVDHSLTSLRTSRQSGYEESWVHSVSSGYWRQDKPLYLTTRCFLTRTYNAQRLRWMLKGDGQVGDIKAFVGFMGKLSQVLSTAGRDDIKSLLDAMQGHEQAKIASPLQDVYNDFKNQSKEVSALTVEAAKDLAQDLSDIPDSTLGADLSHICADISNDVQIAPAETLANFDRVRNKLLTTSGARLFTVGAEPTMQAIQPDLSTLLKGLGDAPFKSVTYSADGAVLDALKQRDKIATRPVYVGFVNANTQQGVFLYSAPSIKYTNTDTDALLDFLSFQQYSGGGSHSLFMKTWAAGLAYSSGVGQTPNRRMNYYADKAPQLSNTMQFVIEQLKHAPRDLDLADYAVAASFSSSAAGSYEGRGEAIAEELIDGESPDVVKKFRTALLDLRKRPTLATDLRDRMLTQYGRLFPGLGVDASQVADSVYMVIGDEKQMGLYEQYLKATVGSDTKLYRVYGRDFWQFGQKQ